MWRLNRLRCLKEFKDNALSLNRRIQYARTLDRPKRDLPRQGHDRGDDNGCRRYPQTAGVILRRWGPKAFLGVIAIFVHAKTASASDNQMGGVSPDAPAWIITIGGSAEYGPVYPGSSKNGLSGLPSFDIRRFGEPDENSAPDDNLDYSLIDLGRFEAGPVLGLRDRRSISDDTRLGGLHTIDWGVDLGVFAQYWLVPDTLRLRTEVRQALSNGSGLAVDIGADWFIQPAEGWTFSMGPRLSFGNGRYMKQYFSVSDAEAAANGNVDPFQANGGLKSVGATISATYDITPSWSIQVYDRFDRLVGDAADSPVTRKFGSASQNIIGVSLSKSFAVRF